MVLFDEIKNIANYAVRFDEIKQFNYVITSSLSSFVPSGYIRNTTEAVPGLHPNFPAGKKMRNHSYDKR